MSNLKIKVTLGSFNVELDGSSEDVKFQFEELKKNGLGEMVNQLIPLLPTPNSSSKNTYQLPLAQTNNDSSYITANVEGEQQDSSLQDVVFKLLPQSEKEWILIYSYFL